MNNSIAAIILTYNEEKHISRCINSLKNICEEIFVIDSFSKDRTVEIAKESGAQVYQKPLEKLCDTVQLGAEELSHHNRMDMAH